jgi:hypothetical protein
MVACDGKFPYNSSLHLLSLIILTEWADYHHLARPEGARIIYNLNDERVEVAADARHEV